MKLFNAIKKSYANMILRIKLYYIRKLNITVYFDREGYVIKKEYTYNGKELTLARFEKSVALMLAADYCDGKNIHFHSH